MVACRAPAVALLVISLVTPSAASADDLDVNPEPPAGLRTLAVMSSFVPGALLHGSGHFVLGRRDAAYSLFAVQGVGLGMMLAGGLPIVFTAANRYITREAAVVGALGLGLWAISWQADIYGALVPTDARGHAETSVSHAEVEGGFRYVYDPRFRYSAFVHNALALRTGGLSLKPSAMVALDDNNRRLRVEGGYRFFGPRAQPRQARDGTYLELAAAVTDHLFGTEGFETVTPEVCVRGRLDLSRLHPDLTGMFGELGVGFGLQLFDYPRSSLGEDVEALLLARMGWGFYLGGPETPLGEVISYYDHRHDDYVGGFNETSIGVPGHIGFAGRGWLSDNVGFNALFEAGAAMMVGGSLMLRDTRP